MKKNLIGTGFIVTGIFVLWACFFKLAPWLIAMCGWEKLIKVVICALIACFGGFGLMFLSFFFIAIGIIIIIFGGEEQ